VLFTIGRAVIAEYLARSAPGSAYGAAGSLVVLLIWVNYSSLILLFGAAFNRAYLQHRDVPVVPRRGAVRVKRKLLEDSPAKASGQ